MASIRKPVVRLQGSAWKKPRESAPISKQETVKLAIRICEGVNEALRSLIRYRGDLSKMALEAFAEVDLDRAALVDGDGAMVAATTISMSPQLRDKLRKIAVGRYTSMNILVNTA